MDINELEDQYLKLQAMLGATKGANAAKVFLAAYSQSFENTLIAENEQLVAQLNASIEKMIDLRKRQYSEVLSTGFDRLSELDKKFFKACHAMLNAHDKLFSEAFERWIEIQNRSSQELIERLNELKQNNP